jgi:hypothetical protein
MIELILLVCLTASPEQCHEERPAFQATGYTMTACLFQGQIIAAQWQDEHPKYVIRRWTCGMTKT